jgi:hypothetical protein
VGIASAPLDWEEPSCCCITSVKLPNSSPSEGGLFSEDGGTESELVEEELADEIILIGCCG